MAEQPKQEPSKTEEPKKDISNTLESKLEKRPSAKQAGHGLDTKLAPTLQATAKKLETEQKKDIVRKIHLIHSSISDRQETQPTFANTTNIIICTKKKVDKNLKTRPNANDVGVNTQMAPSIQPTAKTLSNKMRRDSLKQSLNARPGTK